MPIYKRKGRTSKDDPWYALYKDQNDVWVRKSTGYTDKKLAEQKLVELQRRSLDPDGATQDSATLTDALNLLLKERASQVKAGLRSKHTLTYYRNKAGTLTAILGGGLLLKNLTAPVIDAYIVERRNGVCENSISKELNALHAAMKLAKRARMWAGDMSIFPIAFAPEYVPRKRFMTLEEIDLYRAVMAPDRFAILAFSVATSAEWAAWWRATPGDISKDFTVCHVHGSKNKNRDRTIPILLPACQELLKEAKAKANQDKKQGLLFTWEPSFRHTLNEATAAVYPCECFRRDIVEHRDGTTSTKITRRVCAKCRKVKLSPNDLRRTHGKWLRQAGVSNDDAAPMLGHADGTMMAKVYGTMSPMELAPQLRKQLERSRQA